MVLIRDSPCKAANDAGAVVGTLLTGLIRKAKARLLRARAVSDQPIAISSGYAQGAVLAVNASWLFRAVPYLVFAATWVAAALSNLRDGPACFSWSPTLLHHCASSSARFFLALAGMDVGTSFAHRIPAAK